MNRISFHGNLKKSNQNVNNYKHRTVNLYVVVRIKPVKFEIFNRHLHNG